MNVPYGSILSPYFQDVYTRLLQHDYTSYKDKFLILQVERSLAPHLEDSGKLHQEVLEEHGERHPDKPGVFIFPKEDEEGEWEVDYDATQETSSLIYVTDEEKLDKVREAQQELSQVTFEYEPLLTLDFFERSGIEMTTGELASLWFLFEEGAELSPVKEGLTEQPPMVD